MSFSRGDISLTNTLLVRNTDVLQLKKQNEVVSLNQKDSSGNTEELEKVDLSDAVYNNKITDTNKILEDNQTSFNVLESYKESLLKTYDYLEEMKKILKDKLEESKNKALENFDEITFSVNDYVEKINDESKKVDSQGENLTNQNLKNNDKIKNELDLNNFSSDSLGISNNGNISIKNKEESEDFLSKINNAEKILKDSLNSLSDQKDNIEKNTNSLIDAKNTKQDKPEPNGIINLVQSITSSLIQNPNEGIKMQIKNINEQVSLPLLGFSR